ncbi:MAG: hypothetical protein COV75_03810 [Candidatus Omnitrophica bacterium CG11_big_fil_rev_8_21_14_0_20_63_9]|nr:MAG: hypothetical protein COV75_03810 [Candidatus Omnitrophica bacterium CG11_big_fil_rev_8_21_14_0_20_63_9]
MRRLWIGASVAMLAVGGLSASADESTEAGPSPKAQSALQLLKSEDPYQRQLGFLRLEALREASTVPMLQEYATHRDAEVRAYSLRAIAAIQGAGAVPQLLEALRTDRHPKVRRAALLGLEPLQASDPATLPAMLKALHDRDTSVRMTAVDIVSRIDDARAVEAIRERNKREHRRDVRRVLSAAMKRLDQRDGP